MTRPTAPKGFDAGAQGSGAGSEPTVSTTRFGAGAEC
jgi:hypothetical protein